MTAAAFVLIAILVIVLALALLALRRLWWLALPALILAILAVVAEAPRAAAELWGERLTGVVASTRESTRLETSRSSGARTSHYAVQHRFGAVVCYRAADAPGLGAGAPLDPAIRAAIGEAESDADRRCQAAPGSGVLRQAEVRLDEAAHDAAILGAVVPLIRLRPLGLLEWTWTADAPLLPWLPRPSLAGGARVTVPAQVVDITIDRRGRTLLSRRAQDYAVPVGYVRLRYSPPGLPGPVEGIDTVDAPAVAGLVPGTPVTITLAADAPRAPHLVGVTRSYWWRNVIVELLLAGAVALGLVAVVLVLRRRRRPA